MTLPVHGKLVSEPFELCGLCAQAPRKVILRRLHNFGWHWDNFLAPRSPARTRALHYSSISAGKLLEIVPWQVVLAIYMLSVMVADSTLRQRGQWQQVPCSGSDARCSSFNPSNLPPHTDPHGMLHI